MESKYGVDCKKAIDAALFKQYPFIYSMEVVCLCIFQCNLSLKYFKQEIIVLHVTADVIFQFRFLLWNSLRVLARIKALFRQLHPSHLAHIRRLSIRNGVLTQC